MAKNTKNDVALPFKTEKIKMPCRAPMLHCTSFYEYLWASQSKILKIH